MKSLKIKIYLQNVLFMTGSLTFQCHSLSLLQVVVIDSLCWRNEWYLLSFIDGDNLFYNAIVF